MTNFIKQTSDDQHLQDMLRKVALDDNTIIMTSVNEAWAAQNSLLDSFFESFRVGEGTEQFLKHIFVVALDAKAYERCKSLHPYCYFLKQNGLDLSEAQSYMKNVYLDLVWSKLKLQQRILELGYNLLFTVIYFFRSLIMHMNIFFFSLYVYFTVITAFFFKMLLSGASTPLTYTPSFVLFNLLFFPTDYTFFLTDKLVVCSTNAHFNFFYNYKLALHCGIATITFY